MNIVTITLNPAFDLHLSLPVLKVGKENTVASVMESAGGKGVNISRALLANGIGSTAVFFAGEENGEKFTSILDGEGIVYDALPVPGRIRENFTLHEDDHRETRLTPDSFSLREEMLPLLYDHLKTLVTSDTLLTFSGRLPLGIGHGAAVDFLCRLKELTPYLIVDSSTLTRDDLIRVRPYMIKPNETEIAALLGREIPDADTKEGAEEMKEVAATLRAEGIGNVLITLGGKGAVFAGEAGCFRASAPKIVPLSTIGAGDSTIAGYLAALVRGEPFPDALKTALAFGSAACLTAGTSAPLREDVERLRENVTVRSL